MNRSPERTILHADLDAFFAAVEQRDDPSLRGKPVVVGGGGPNDRGVVSTASYEARVFGVHSAMPLRTAAALCPQAIFVPVNGAKYTTASKHVMEILGRFSPLVEQLSIDEAFVDLTGTEALLGPPEAAGRALKQAVHAETQLTVSVGIASNRLVAKIASDLRKPDGLVLVPRGDEAAFLEPLAIERLWGVGASTRKALAQYDVKTIGDLARLPEEMLVRRFGSHGHDLASRARGVGETDVGDRQAAKSVSQEHTYDVDTSDWAVQEQTLLALSDGVARRVARDGRRRGDDRSQDSRLIIRDHHPPADPPAADRPGGRHLAHCGRADPARGARTADSASWRRRERIERRAPAGSVRVRG